MKQQIRIVHIKLINHIVLGNIDFELDNDIVSILGKNGSGKSFLMDTLHPFSRSNRFISSYPVKAGATGYKQVDFSVNGNILYETIHEYVPKGKSHACKSYINKIEKGVKIELNPTGHCEKYEELVKRYLGFDNNCMTIGFLSSVANGITSSRGQERKKILESTIDNPILKMFKKNAKELAKEYTSMTKHYEKQKIRIANTYSEESLLEQISKITNDIELNRISLKKANEDFEIMTGRLKDLEDKSHVNFDKLKTICDLTFGLQQDKTTYFIYQTFKDVLERSEKLSNEYIQLDEQLQRITKRDTLEHDIKASRAILDEKSKELHEYENRLYKYVVEDRRDSIKSWLENIIRLAKYFTDVFKGLSVVATSSSNLDNIISELVEQKKSNEEFMIRYRAALSNIDGNKYVVNVQDNCNTCQLYDKFVKSDEFVTANKTKWDNMISIEQPEIEDKLQKLSIVKENVKSSLIHSIEQASLYIKDLSKAGLTSLDSFLRECGTGVLYPKLTNFYDWVNEHNSYIDSLSTNVKDLESKIDYMDKELEYIVVPNGLNVDSMTARKNEIQETLKKYDKMIANSTYKAIGALDMTDSEIFKLSNMTLYDLNKLYLEVKDIDLDIENTNRVIEKIKYKRINLPTTIESLLVEKTQTESKLSDLRTLNKNLLEYDRKGKVLVRCKDLLDKDIPISLLRNNLAFIEKTTNAILINNSIQMGVNIIPSETEITIEVTVRDKTINDAIQLSSGETAIISLLINACILHIVGYPIICIDELDANLDVIYRSKFNDLIYSIMTVLQISQVFCISHNIASNINYATKILVGSEDGLDLNAYDCTSLIKL